MTFDHDYYRLIDYVHEITRDRDDVVTTAFGHPDQNSVSEYTIAICVSTPDGAGWVRATVPHTHLTRDRVHHNVKRALGKRWAVPHPPMMDRLALSEDRLSSDLAEYEGLTTAVAVRDALRAILPD